MKKFIAATLTAIMILSLAACGKAEIEDARDVRSDDVAVEEFSDGTKQYKGNIGSTFSTEWFDFTVIDAYFTKDEIGGKAPSEGNVFVVVEMDIKNSFPESVGMWTYDFQLQWNDDAPDAFSYPIEEDGLMDEQFPSEYTLKVNESRHGFYIYQAPEGFEDFSISFLERLDDGSDEGAEGDLFWVYFTAEEK